MKFFKLCSALTALVLFGVALGMFALNFVYFKAVVLNVTTITNIGTGFQFAFNSSDLKIPLDDGKNLGTLFAFIFVALGAACALCTVILTFLKGDSKKKKADVLAKRLCACCLFTVCGLVPAILLFLTLVTTGFNEPLLGAKPHLGTGAILAAIFTLIGGGALGAAELK